MEKVVIEPHMKRPIWDYLFYASMSVLTIWLILKVVGIIKTPVWLEYGVPIGSAIVSFATLFQSINNKFDKINDSISDLRSSDARLESKLIHLDRDIERLKDKLSA